MVPVRFAKALTITARWYAYPPPQAELQEEAAQPQQQQGGFMSDLGNAAEMGRGLWREESLNF